MAQFIESECAFTHEGKTFVAGGSYKTEDCALVYISNTEGVYTSTSWHGQPMGQVKSHILGTERWGRYGYYRMAYVRVLMDGAEWWGRYNCDSGQAVRLRRARG